MQRELGMVVRFYFILNGRYKYTQKFFCQEIFYFFSKKLKSAGFFQRKIHAEFFQGECNP